MGRLDVADRTMVDTAAPALHTERHPVVVFTGNDHRLTTYSPTADRLLGHRFERGVPVRILFPEREARAVIAAMDLAYESREPVIIRQRLWQFVERNNLRNEVKLVVKPYYEGSQFRPAGVVVEAHTACNDPNCDALDRCCRRKKERPSSPEEALRRMPQMPAPGAMAFFEQQVHNLAPESALSLVEIRQAARDAFVEAAGPLVDEIARLRRGGSSTHEIRPRYQQPRPS
jgi:hypothetical protein